MSFITVLQLLLNTSTWSGDFSSNFATILLKIGNENNNLRERFSVSAVTYFFI